MQGKVGAVIPAAGMARRMGCVDKMFLNLAGLPVLVHTVEAFQACAAVDLIVVVLSEASLDRGRALARERGWSKILDVCLGGERRQDSVWAGLQRLSGCQWVVIHDGARPLVTPGLIARGLAAAQEVGAAVAATPVKDTIKVADDQNVVVETLERRRLWAVQTPQIFRYDLICKAYQSLSDEVTDDATLVERLGHPVKLYMGDYANIKITTPEDLVIAEALLKERERLRKGGAIGGDEGRDRL